MNFIERFAQDPVDFEALVEHSLEHLRYQTAAHNELWQLGECSWSVDQDEGTLVFTRPDGTIATCPVQIIGTYNTADGTWLWGWDHPSVKEPLQESAHLLREWGEERGIEVLTTRKISCTEDDAWGLTALAFALAEAQGAYRGPMGPTHAFMTFGEIALSSE